MGANMQKGGNVSLTKLAKGAGVLLTDVVVACGWDAKQKGGLLRQGETYDLDLTAAALDASGKVPSQNDPTDPYYQEWFIHANHRYPSGRSIVFAHDNRTGEGDGDDEQIGADLTKVPSFIERIVYAVVIWRAKEREQKFGNVKNAFIRVYDQTTGREFARYDLGADFSNETLVVFGELYRRGDEWKFRAIGQGYAAATYRLEYNIQKEFELEYARDNYPN